MKTKLLKKLNKKFKQYVKDEFCSMGRKIYVDREYPGIIPGFHYTPKVFTNIKDYHEYLAELRYDLFMYEITSLRIRLGK